MQQHMQRNGVESRPDSSRENMPQQNAHDRQSMADDQLTRRKKKPKVAKLAGHMTAAPLSDISRHHHFHQFDYFATLSNLRSWYKHMHVGPCGALYPLKSTPSLDLPFCAARRVRQNT